jgi:hypothetical protein
MIAQRRATPRSGRAGGPAAIVPLWVESGHVDDPAGEQTELVAHDGLADTYCFVAIYADVLDRVTRASHLANDVADRGIWIFVEQVLGQRGPIGMTGAARLVRFGEPGSARGVERSRHQTLREFSGAAESAARMIGCSRLSKIKIPRSDEANRPERAILSLPQTDAA